MEKAVKLTTDDGQLTTDNEDTKARKGNEEDRIYGIKKAQKTQRIQKLDTDSR